MNVTQNDRVLAALKQAGKRGVTELDFEAPRVTDGGKPIRRLAARVCDLRNQGLPVLTVGERDGVAVYVLPGSEAEPQATVHRLPEPSPSPAVDDAGQLTVFDYLDREAS